jgi:hypothetical protein
MMPGVGAETHGFLYISEFDNVSFCLTFVKARHCGHVQNITEALVALAVVAESRAVLACAPGAAIS